MTRFALILVIALFGAYSGYVILQYGYVGLWHAAFANIATTQVIIDLVITSTLAIIWMIADARRTGRNAWPYVFVTVAAGSFGPLCYLLMGLYQGPHGALQTNLV